LSQYIEIVEPSATLETYLVQDDILRAIERAGRTCYKSECRITDDSAEKFTRMIMKSHHESVIEHYSITVRIVCNRGVSHELVRHRLASYSQESTRYCNYGKAGKIKVIRPFYFPPESMNFHRWWHAMDFAAQIYLDMLADGATPQQARGVLPNDLKTEIVVTANLRMWRTIFDQRCAAGAHPQIRQIMLPLLHTMARLLPVIFEDLADRFLPLNWRDVEGLPPMGVAE
jgi:thymidylate synthase (FAD)